MIDDPDSIIDAALREYSNPDARPGLAGRILRNAREAPPVRHSRWWAGWTFAGVALMLILLSNHPHRVSQTPPVSRVYLPLGQPLPAPNRGARSVREDAVAGQRKGRVGLPKLEVFSGPEPLTPEERELLRLVQDQPHLVRETLYQSAQIEELTIEPLKIEELP